MTMSPQFENQNSRIDMRDASHFCPSKAPGFRTAGSRESPAHTRRRTAIPGCIFPGGAGRALQLFTWEVVEKMMLSVEHFAIERFARLLHGRAFCRPPPC